MNTLREQADDFDIEATKLSERVAGSSDDDKRVILPLMSGLWGAAHILRKIADGREALAALPRECDRSTHGRHTFSQGRCIGCGEKQQ